MLNLKSSSYVLSLEEKVAALLDHAAPKIVEGELSGPFKATEASTARKKVCQQAPKCLHHNALTD